MSDVDNNNKTNGVGGLESGCNDGVNCARRGCRVGALRRGVPEKRVDVDQRKKAVDGAAALSHDVTIMIMVVAPFRAEFSTPRRAASQVAGVA